MRLRLSTLMLLVTVVALGLALSIQQPVPTVVIIDRHEYIWRLGSSQLSRTVWEDTANAPPLSQPEAMETANRIIEHLESCENQLQFGDLSLKSVSLVRIEPNSSSWGYQIFIGIADGNPRSPDLAFLLMMDGTIGFQTLKYGRTLKSVMKKFDPKNRIVHVRSTLK